MVGKVGQLNIGIVFGIFILLISAQLWTDGMFVDGVYYASIARNLSEGIGSFWKLSFSATHDSEFYGHPPLAIGIQSILFKMFGDQFWVERVYSLLAYIVSGYLVIRIWTKLTQDASLSWIPLLLWFSIPTIQWAAANNILENTVTIFVLGALFSIMMAEGKREYFWLAGAGLCILAGFLSKGFTALFPLATPAVTYLIFRHRSLLHTTYTTLYILFWMVIPLSLWMYFDAKVYENLITYFQIQVLDSIEGRVNVASRWHIVIRMLEELLIPAIICLLILGIGRRWKVSNQSVFYKNAIQFSIVGLCGVLPVMVSMKQSGFYIVPAFPVLTLGMALVLVPAGGAITQKWMSLPVFKRYQQAFFSVISVTVVVVAINLFGKIGRDQYFLEDWQLIRQELNSGTTINVCLKEEQIMNIQTYMSRYGKVSMENHLAQSHQFLLVQKEKLSECDVENYSIVPLPTSHFDLFRSKKEKID